MWKTLKIWFNFITDNDLPLWKTLWKQCGYMWKATGLDSNRSLLYNIYTGGRDEIARP